MSWNIDDKVHDGGYVRGGVGGCSTFGITGVDGSSFFIPNLFTPNPLPQYSWFHQTIPNCPSSVQLPLWAILNSLLNCLTFPAWISAARLILFILLLSACFFFICILSAMSLGCRSKMSYRHVSRWMMWMKVWSSNIFGRVKKLPVSMRTLSSLSWSAGWMARHFLLHMFIAEGDITISTIGIKSNPGGWSVYH